MSPEEKKVLDDFKATTVKLETIADSFADTLNDHEDRLRDLEATENKGKGILIALGTLFTVGLGAIAWWK